ncbi:MAG: hypothetical protein ACLP1X_16400, partial [Polyangiaceae bacterium]
RAKLAKYCAASGISERTVIEEALQKHLDGKSDTELLLRRLDLIKSDIARDHLDLELLSEAFGRYMRLWFVAHVPSAGEAGKAAARAAGEVPYRQFAQHLGAQFKQGHRFVDDVPVEAFAAEDDVK